MAQESTALTGQSAIEAAKSFARAMVVGDTATLEALLTEDFTYTHSSAIVEPAADLISTVCAGRRNPRMDFEDLKVRMYPGMAIVSGLNHMHTSRNKRFDALFSLVLVAGDDAWRLLAYHSTRIPEE